MNEDKETADEKDNNIIETKPNENTGIHVSSSLRITDPETGQVLLQMRCD